MSTSIGVPLTPGLLVCPYPAGRELLARFFRALGDPTRLRLLALCATAERTGTECVAEAALSQGRVSAHLACLVDCGLLSVRRHGRYASYHVADPRVTELVTTAAAMVADHTASIAACARVGLLSASTNHGTRA